MTSLGQARQAGRQTDMQTDRQQQQGECSASTPKSLECRFSQILYAEKLAESAKTQNRNRNSPRTRNRTENYNQNRDQTESKTKRNETNFIKLDVTETKSLKLGPRPRMGLNQPRRTATTAKDTNDPRRRSVLWQSGKCVA